MVLLHPGDSVLAFVLPEGRWRLALDTSKPEWGERTTLTQRFRAGRSGHLCPDPVDRSDGRSGATRHELGAPARFSMRAAAACCCIPPRCPDRMAAATSAPRPTTSSTGWRRPGSRCGRCCRSIRWARATRPTRASPLSPAVPLLVDLEDLVERGWLGGDSRARTSNPVAATTRGVAPWRMALLREAWQGFSRRADDRDRAAASGVSRSSKATGWTTTPCS